MSQSLQEYVDSGGLALRVDAAAGVLHGVKILGLASRNGRTYSPAALAAAAPLYEGAKVNVNHPKGHPATPRDYQDRIGVVRRVVFRRDGGLFADFHFNPRHPLAEQLAWDARHAPQNVGFSHNVEARTSRQNGQTVVEAITRVLGVDLVADPATTRGLFESAEQRPAGRLADSTPAQPSPLTTQASLLTPDLDGELAALREEVAQLRAEVARGDRRALVDRLLGEHGLPLPLSNGNGNGMRPAALVSEAFYRGLLEAADEAEVRRLIDERAALVESARRGAASPTSGRPVARMQRPPGLAETPPQPATAREFAHSITR